MKRAAALALIAVSLTLAGCGDGEDASDAASSTSGDAPSPATVTATVTATTAAQPEDATGKGNCIGARLAYAPIASALGGSVDLDQAVQLFSASDVDSATSQAGKDAAVAITAANYELALANADVLTGQLVDAEKLRSLLAAVDVACDPVLSN